MGFSEKTDEQQLLHTPSPELSPPPPIWARLIRHPSQSSQRQSDDLPRRTRSLVWPAARPMAGTGFWQPGSLERVDTGS